MRLTGNFNLSTQSKYQLCGLYRKIFNEAASPEISTAERRAAFALLRLISHQIGRMP